MKHKVFSSVFVLAVALGLVSVTMRTPQTTPTRTPILSAPSAVPTAPAAAAAPVTKLVVPHMDRALAAFRVHENGIVNGMDFSGAGYHARVSETEVRFGTTDGSLVLGAPKIEQGSRIVETAAPEFVHPGFGTAKLERGTVAEEYVFENRRMEQLFRIPAPLGTGDLKISVPISASFPATFENRAPMRGDWDAAEFRDGGVAVLDPAGVVRFTCTQAVVVDSAQGRLTLGVRHENGAIVLEVPETFLAKAAYPITVDPWFGTNGSNTGGGLSGTASTSDRPAFRDNVIAWADNSTGNFEIYARLWTGSGFSDLGGGATAGGVSATGGNSYNPTVINTNGATPMIAWEEDTGSSRAIFVKTLDATKPGATWSELGGSATGLGISANLSFNALPSIGQLRAVVPGIVTVDPTTGAPVSSPATHPIVPVVAWQSGGVGPIYCSAFYPGAPAVPPNALNPTGFPAVPAGWYQLHITGNGQNVSNTFDPNLTVGTGEHPQLVVDSLNQVTIVWSGIPPLATNNEIFASRWTLTGAFAEFEIFPVTSTRNDMRPTANFMGIASNAPGADNVSNTSTGQSQFPSLCIDLLGGLAIAWQETEAVPTPAIVAPATPVTPAQASNSQIYVMRNPGPAGSAWTAIDISASPGGISRSGLAYDGALQVPPVPGNASTPSIDSDGVYVGVAWADTSNSRSSIYVRRALLPNGTWDQVGFQGSAFPPRVPAIFPPPAVPEPAPINGVSKSPNYAYQPKIQMFRGSPMVVWADGSGSTFDILSTSFYPNGPGQAVNVGTNAVDFQLTIRQTSTPVTATSTGTDVPIADFTVGTSIFISSRLFSEVVTPAPAQMWMEIELRPTGTPFLFHPNYQALFNGPDFPPTVLPAPAPTSLGQIQIDGLPNNNYHYIVRTRDDSNRTSPWFEQSNIGGVSFRVNASAAPGGGSNGPVNTAPVNAGNTKNRGNCGLLGLEGAALLGLIRLLRRRRTQ